MHKNLIKNIQSKNIIKSDYKGLFEKIKESKNIIITAHVNPDGDAIGAGMALYLGIRSYFLGNEKNVDKNNKRSVRFVLQDKYPDTVCFLKDVENIEIYKDNNEYSCDLFIFLDCATKERAGKTAILSNSKYVINIDHHISNPKYGDMYIVEDISSTSEIIYKLFKDNNLQLSREIACFLYLGLVNDTGNFCHNNVTPDTFMMAADLIANGADNSVIVREFMNAKSYGAMKLIGKALYEMKFYKEKKLIYFYLPYEDMIKNNGRKEDTESIVEKINEYENSSVSLFLREEESGVIKGSMRSKYDVNVNEIAGLFGGGGHIKASGFTSDKKPDEILKIVLENI